MKVKDLPAKVKSTLLALADAPDQALAYHGSGMGDALRARLVSSGWAERACLGGRETVRLTPMGQAVVRLLRDSV